VIDTVIHVAADVNWVLPYAALHDANVAGTLEALRLACAGRARQVRFVSSQLVGFMPDGPAEVDERTPLLGLADRLPLGYAQSKIVAEALVREAGARGLRVAIYRPALVTGDARTGASNPDDFVGALIKGCLEMGAAPDLNWTVDAVPVDHVARGIVGLPPAAGDPTCYHLTNARPRHWRECVLWMNLYGYTCALIPYDAWLRRLDRDSRDPGHPLHRLRAFFLRRDARGLTAPEHYEDDRRAVVRADRTRDALVEAGLECPALSADLLARYFDDFIQRGFLPEPPGRRPAKTRRPKRSVARRLEEVLRRRTADPTLIVRDATRIGDGADHSIIGELTAWRHGPELGLAHYRVTIDQAGGTTRRDLVVKRKPSDEDVLDVGETVAALCDPALGRAWRDARELVGARHGHLRELAVYDEAGADARGFMPRCDGSWRDDADADWGLVLERLDGLALMDAVDDPDRWARPYLDAAVDGLAALHAAWAPRVTDLAACDWIDHRRLTATAADLAPLRAALRRHAAPFHARWAGDALVRVHDRLLGSAGAWWPRRAAGLRTLIHNDCNPRNLGLRHDPDGYRLCIYDWELATIGPPQRDLAELLCFVLPPDVDPEVPLGLAERHRSVLEARLGPIDAEAWRHGLVDALAEVLVDRLSTYTMINRVRPQPFLPRVLRTWLRVFEGLAPASGGAVLLC
jgi:thioester reductase-like protein